MGQCLSLSRRNSVQPEHAEKELAKFKANNKTLKESNKDLNSMLELSEGHLEDARAMFEAEVKTLRQENEFLREDNNRLREKVQEMKGRLVDLDQSVSRLSTTTAEPLPRVLNEEAVPRASRESRKKSSDFQKEEDAKLLGLKAAKSMAPLKLTRSNSR
ncbi:hypothetical protein CYMTET_29496 [Cymbomonas tetramitiformis]|uniref:Uncharacterized protein n=1 Tax=Cymbomonas tetramitiformis TaxID=36881 RepID=A0AAE0FKY0_9CHLO|nr:hypothetical protein CYMTET_29496 [Cymbomonas tetramitiformis]